MTHLRKYAPEIVVSLFAAALWVWFLLLFTAPPADAQEAERCTVQSFDPPIGPTFAMPGDADRVTITLADGSSTTLIGPFVLGDVIDAGGPVTRLEKCSGVGPPVPPDPTPEPPTPEPTPSNPAATPTPEPQPTPTPPSDDSCCTTIVTPGPTVTPTPVIPTPPTPPVDPTPTPEVPTATPTPGTPMLPETGTTSAPLAVLGAAFIAGGLIARTVRRIR